MATYDDFLRGKAQLEGEHGFAPDFLPDFLFPFQAALVDWSLRKGRGAIFADCGLGKTPMQLVWAENVHRRMRKPVLILTPLAVSFQTEEEAHKFNIDACVSRNGKIGAGVTITNYDRLHLFDPADYAGVVCDESSAIKSFDGQRRAVVTEFMRRLPYRLLCTATAAPNDYIELGTSSEALGYLGYMDMLGRFFTDKERTGLAQGARFQRLNARNGARFQDRERWRFKGHAEHDFWRWVSSWARAMRQPSDLGFSDDGFDLPPLEHREHVVSARQIAPGRLFDVEAQSLQEEREETRRTLAERCEMTAGLLADADSAVAWCHLNDEGDRLTRLIDGAVQVKGSDSTEAKEEALMAFGRGEIRVLVTKPSIASWGLNWQHCARMTFFPSHSYEQYYQAVRRCWRFGQKRPVLVDIVTTEGGAKALANLQRKADQAARMFDALVEHMQDALAIKRSNDYTDDVEVPAWL